MKAYTQADPFARICLSEQGANPGWADAKHILREYGQAAIHKTVVNNVPSYRAAAWRSASGSPAA